MYQARINNKSLDITSSDDSFLVDGKKIVLDKATLADGYFHILHDNKSYRAEVVKADIETKTFTIRINGRNYTVALKDKFDLLLEKMGMNNGAAGKVNALKAPMPGLILDLKVQAGDAVKPGDILLILEAMKMENILKSPGEGVVKNVKIKKGDSVEKGQVLIEF